MSAYCHHYYRPPNNGFVPSGTLNNLQIQPNNTVVNTYTNQIIPNVYVLLIDDAECKGNSGEGNGHRNRTTTTTKASSGRKRRDVINTLNCRNATNVDEGRN
ncbi:unnamed protein product [Chironomus riparius]|uniref:Uncharacterized protein n=1 Tax=Chironomus riparius TaxID=315576 RepID=A0A9N9WS99_9DIPT|nr:unnamed protein product [Chironomus riparius]